MIFRLYLLLFIKEYSIEFRDSLHPYIKDFVDIAIPYLAKE